MIDPDLSTPRFTQLKPDERIICTFFVRKFKRYPWWDPRFLLLSLILFFPGEQDTLRWMEDPSLPVELTAFLTNERIIFEPCEYNKLGLVAFNSILMIASLLDLQMSPYHAGRAVLAKAQGRKEVNQAQSLQGKSLIIPLDLIERIEAINMKTMMRLPNFGIKTALLRLRFKNTPKNLSREKGLVFRCRKYRKWNDKNNFTLQFVSEILNQANMFIR